ncbi:MAG: hypothetical protein WCA35_04005 [Kovacikia sp.]
MKRYLKSGFVKAIIWLAAEVLLNVVGLDNLADYGEFVFERELHVNGTSSLAITALLR